MPSSGSQSSTLGWDVHHFGVGPKQETLNQPDEESGTGRPLKVRHHLAGTLHVEHVGLLLAIGFASDRAPVVLFASALVGICISAGTRAMPVMPTAATMTAMSKKMHGNES
jgi:hypothetical protein